MVDCLKDLNVELLCGWGVEWHPQGHECIGETLDADANGAMAEVRLAGFGNWVVVDINDAVQVERHNFGDIVEFLEVIGTILNKGGESKRGEVAHGNFIWCRVLDDFRAQVGRLDGSEILLVGLAVGSVLLIVNTRYL